ncbi:transposase [Streptomyces buecherae]
MHDGQLRTVLAGLPQPRAADCHRVLTVDVSPWPQLDATCSARPFCRTYGRGDAKRQMIPGCPYSIVVALETGRMSWTAVRLEPGADLAAVTAARPRNTIVRLIGAVEGGQPEPPGGA